MSKVEALLIEDDCLSAMSAIPNRSVNLILCDLPYGTTQNAWDSVIPLDELWKQYRRVLAPKGVVALMSQGPFTARVILSQESIFKYKITWVKSKPTNFLNAKKQPLRKHEDICVFYAQQPNYTPQMQPGEAYDKGVRKNQLTGSYGDFRPSHVKSEGGRYGLGDDCRHALNVSKPPGERHHRTGSSDRFRRKLLGHALASGSRGQAISTLNASAPFGCDFDVPRGGHH